MLGKALLLALVLLVSGCFQNDGGKSDPDEPGTDPPIDGNQGNNETNGNNGENGNVTPPPDVPREFTLTDCEYQASAFQWLGPNGPGEVPPGWEAETTTGSRVLVTFIECARLSWGPFERPIVLAVEDHSKGVTKQECEDQTNGGNMTAGTIHRVWTNDTEVASYLTDTYGIPTGIATIMRDDTALQSAGRRTWTLQPEGAEASYLEFTKAADNGGQTDGPLRFIWWNGTVIGFLDLYRSYTSANDSKSATGEMFPPTLNAEAGVGPWAGVADWFYDMEVNGEVYMWQGLDCTTPF